MSELMSELAELAHKHQLVPFLGAGCSKPHVGVDWDMLTDQLKQQISGPVDPDWTHPEVAEVFVQEHGGVRLAEVIAEKLLLDEFDDGLGTTPSLILALELRSIYTTNQDNVVELASASRGRPLVSVSTLDDLKTARPGDRVLYHFHGRADAPGTLVYTASQYDARIDESGHFMNVRLRSDLLTKRFFFVGYSFQDSTTRSLFQEMNARFPEQLPGSYLLAYRWSDELNQLCSDHGVQCIDPSQHLDGPPAATPDEALERFLARLCNETFQHSGESEVETLFSPNAPVPSRRVIRQQLDAITKAAQDSRPADALAAFRGACDLAEIPESLHGQVVEAFVTIVRRAPPELEGDVKAALMWLELPGDHLLDPIAAYLAMANRLPRPHRFSIHIPHTERFPEALLPVAAARAVELLEAWGEEIGDDFYSRTTQWFDGHWLGLRDEWKTYVRENIDRAWKARHTIHENPIDRAERLGTLGINSSGPTFPEVQASILSKIPRRFKTPTDI